MYYFTVEIEEEDDKNYLEKLLDDVKEFYNSYVENKEN